MTDEDKTNEASTNEAATSDADAIKKQRDEQIINSYKASTAQGFSREQTIQQLSSKYQMTVADVTLLLNNNDETKEEPQAEPKQAAADDGEKPAT